MIKEFFAFLFGRLDKYKYVELFILFLYVLTRF